MASRTRSLALILSMVLLSSSVPVAASSRSSLVSKKMLVASTKLPKVSEGKERVVVGSPEKMTGAAAMASTRQVPTGPDPIHHNGSPVRHFR